LCTSEKIVGIVRLTHPFPSILVALTTGALAFLASGSAVQATRLTIAMLGLQLSIGALNDLVDAPLDAGRKPGKPIPRGAATPASARLITAAGLGLAVGLTLPSGPAATTALLACAACGYAYDLRISRTAWSWLPLAIALPLVPVYAWLGATGRVPAELLVVVPAGILAGAGLALANALADLERDRSSGAASAAVRLGPVGTWATQAALLAGAVTIVVVARPAALFGSLAAGPGLAAGVTAAGIATLVVGLALGRSGGAARRERAWELEAIGVALVGGGWLASIVGPG
jgi:protoheme IX farnesyltransferase